MTCREFIDFLSEYLEGELPEASRAAFEAHLAACVDCSNYLKSYRKTIAMGRLAFGRSDEPLPGGVPEDLVKAILASRPRQS